MFRFDSRTYLLKISDIVVDEFCVAEEVSMMSVLTVVKTKHLHKLIFPFKKSILYLMRFAIVCVVVKN